MKPINKILLFFILPILGVLSYDPAFLFSSVVIVGIVIVFLAILGYFLWKGNANVLTFSIFLQGMNSIIRIMLLMSGAIDKKGVFDLSFTIFGFVGLIISIYLLMRLDKPDIRKNMIH